MEDKVDNVSVPRTEYKTYLPEWNLVSDACEGAAAIKGQTTKYLPKPNPQDVSEENRQRYEDYLLRAVYYNATGRTLRGLLGLAFNTEPQVKLPSVLEYMEKDSDGSGVPLIQTAQKVLSEVLKAGRAGILCDYPPTNGAVSKAQQQAGDVRAMLCIYGARDIINWRTTKRGGKVMLSMLVLKEAWEEDGTWVSTVRDQYRVLRLSDVGYTQEIWRQKQDKPDEWEMSQAPVTILMGNGRQWAEIPFTFVGAEDNDTDIDGSPLYDLAVINLAHFRNSADFEDSAYFCGQPQFFMAGLTESWRDDLEKKGTYVGSRTVLPLPVGGSAGVLQAQPNTLVRTAMQDKEQQMAAIGARILLATGQVKTATQQNSEDSAAHSQLSLCCDNTSSGVTKGLQWAAQFENVDSVTDETCSLKINTDFVIQALDANTLLALLQGVQSGRIPENDFWQKLRDVGLIDPQKTDDMIREEISNQVPLGPGLNFSSGGADGGSGGPSEGSPSASPGGNASGGVGNNGG